MTLDFVSIHSYLTLMPVHSLAEECGVELKLWPLKSPGETDPKRSSGEESISDRHRRVRATYSRREHERYAAVQGLPLEIRGYDQDSTLALRGLLVANGAGVGYEFASTVMTRFWAGQLPIGSGAAIAGVLQECGVDEFDLSDTAYDLDPVRRHLAERELFATPMILVDGERYLGRQHIPMIRWQLKGRPEPAKLL